MTMSTAGLAQRPWRAQSALASGTAASRRITGPVRGGLGPLPVPVLLQCGDRGAVQCDHPGRMLRLGRADCQSPVVLLQLLADHRRPAVQVHIAPAQPGRLTLRAARAAQSGDTPRTASYPGPSSGTRRPARWSTPPPAARGY